MCEAPTLRSKRLIVTEHGMSYGGRPLRKRSAHSNREGSRLTRGDGRTIHRVKGHRWSGEQEPCGTRNAESQSGTERHVKPKGDWIGHWRAK